MGRRLKRPRASVSWGLLLISMSRLSRGIMEPAHLQFQSYPASSRVERDMIIGTRVVFRNKASLLTHSSCKAGQASQVTGLLDKVWQSVASRCNLFPSL